MDFSNLLWVIPFIGIIFSMSFVPLLYPKFWERNGRYVPFVWTAVYLIAVGIFFGVGTVPSAIYKPILEDYVSFVVQIATLYIVAGGIYIAIPGMVRFLTQCFYCSDQYSLVGLERLVRRCF